MSFFKPLPAPNHVLHGATWRVNRRGWLLGRAGASVSASLVLLACSGVADLELGQDSNSLQGAGLEPSGAGDVAPDAVTPDTSEPSGVSPDPVPPVDPATGEVPCEVAPEAILPVTSGGEPVEPSWGQPVPEAEPVNPAPEPEQGAELPVASGGEPVEHAEEAGGQPVSTPTGTGAVSLQPCVPVAGTPPVVTPDPGPGAEPPTVSPNSPNPPVADPEAVTPTPTDGS